tara:strand:+ start:151701 stop:151865 length:165 start_codon:yes stop_codon:yes gene_type:complete
MVFRFYRYGPKLLNCSEQTLFWDTVGKRGRIFELILIFLIEVKISYSEPDRRLF